MKVKILFPPLIIVICIALMVWFVYPAYTNGVDGWKERREQLNTQKNNLIDAQQKADNMSKMIAQLESNKIDKDTIFTYIPDQLKEEEIMDNLNFIATNEGLSVIKLSISPESVMRQENTNVNSMGNLAVDSSGVSVGQTAADDLAIKGKNYDVEFSVIGSYDKIKNVLDKVYKLKRYNNIKELKISENKPQVSGKEEAAAPADNLEADMTLTFSYLKKYSKAVNMNNATFSQTSFDMKVAQAIRDKKSVDVLKMNIDQVGRPNPFIP
ncbi:MAG TPA: hypothetical protein VK255_02240 [Patescibacteria group bacterium]|nr:hypothetical protein [Patescibacteria group bacterium]